MAWILGAGARRRRPDACVARGVGPQGQPPALGGVYSAKQKNTLANANVSHLDLLG